MFPMSACRRSEEINVFDFGKNEHLAVDFQFLFVHAKCYQIWSQMSSKCWAWEHQTHS